MFSVVRGGGIQQVVGLVTGLVILRQEVGAAGPLLLVAALVVAGALRVLSWSRHTYELTGDRIVERRGVLARSERALELARIQQVDVNRSVLDRIVGTAELRLETASDGGDSEISLKVVDEAEADRLRDLLRAASRLAPSSTAVDDTTGGTATTSSLPPPEPRAEVLLEVPLAHVALAAVTGRRLLLVPAGLVFLLSLVDDLGVVSDLEETAGELTVSLGIAGAITLVLVGAVVAALATVVAGVLRDGGWTLTATPEALRVRRGMTTERTATVPHRRVQRVSIERSWLRGQLGFASLTIHSAGGGGAGDNPNEALDRELRVPLLPESQVDALVDRLLGVTGDRPVLTGHPRIARRRSALRGAAGLGWLALPLAGATVATGEPVFAWLAPLPLVLGALLGLQRHRRRATGLSSDLVASRTGLVGSTTVLTPRRKVQGVTSDRSWFQRRRALTTVRVHVAGPAGGVSLVDLDEGRAAALHDALVLSRPAAAPVAQPDRT